MQSTPARGGAPTPRNSAVQHPLYASIHVCIVMPKLFVRAYRLRLGGAPGTPCRGGGSVGRSSRDRWKSGSSRGFTAAAKAQESTQAMDSVHRPWIQGPRRAWSGRGRGRCRQDGARRGASPRRREKSHSGSGMRSFKHVPCDTYDRAAISFFSNGQDGARRGASPRRRPARTLALPPSVPQKHSIRKITEESPKLCVAVGIEPRTLRSS